MKPNRFSLLLVVLLAALVLMPVRLTAQGQSRWALGLGLGRQIPQRPILNAQGSEPDYTLRDAGSSMVALEYWFSRMFAGRLAYQWVRTDIEEPDIPSFARIWSLYGGLVFSPVAIAQRARPHLVAGVGARRYNVNAILSGSPDDYDIAPTQIRLAGYGGVGVGLRIGRLELVPEVGAFMNSFEPELGTAPTQLDLVLSLKFQAR